MSRLTQALFLAGALVLAGSGMGHADRAEVQLVMFEQKRCDWCREWHQVIGPIYPKTPEGEIAPLRRVDIHKPLPDDLAGINPGRFTPTFVLVRDGKEMGRIRGYPGEDFFWGLLTRMIAKMQATPAGAS